MLSRRTKYYSSQVNVWQISHTKWHYGGTYVTLYSALQWHSCVQIKTLHNYGILKSQDALKYYAKTCVRVPHVD